MDWNNEGVVCLCAPTFTPPVLPILQFGRTEQKHLKCKNKPQPNFKFGLTDSRRFGFSYLFAIGIPSIISAASSNAMTTAPFQTHSKYWTEKRANRHAEKYFRKHYGVDWDRQYSGSEWRYSTDEFGITHRYRYFFTIRDWYPF